MQELVEKKPDYYLQRHDGLWDVVDEYVFKNWKHVQNDPDNGDTSPKYNGHKVTKSEEGIAIQASELDNKGVAIIARFLGVKPEDAPPKLEGGFVHAPPMVDLKIGNSKMLHKMFGDNFRKV